MGCLTIRRARRTAAVELHRKATTDLVSSMLTFDEDEHLHWATELFPTSAQGRKPAVTPWILHLLRLMTTGTGAVRDCARPDWHST